MLNRPRSPAVIGGVEGALPRHGGEGGVAAGEQIVVDVGEANRNDKAGVEEGAGLARTPAWPHQASVDTSNPATNRLRKSGHHADALGLVSGTGRPRGRSPVGVSYASYGGRKRARARGGAAVDPALDRLRTGAEPTQEARSARGR